MPTLPDFRLETYFSRWEFAARFHLTASDAQTLSLTELLDLADGDGRARWDSLHLGYTETYGLPALREAIASTYDGLAREDILCFAGAEEALYLAMRVLLDPSDHAVVVTPNYQAAETIPLSICEVTGVALKADDGWALDLETLESALRPATRLVSVNFPNNPTGAVPDEVSWRRLVDLCEQRGIFLFSDEVYRGLELNGSTFDTSRRPFPHRALSQRHVQGVRTTGPAGRLDRLPRPVGPGSPRTRQALHLNL